MKCEYTFSVITVCYNAAGCIEKTIQSVKEQDCDDFEYLIIDGLSKDDTIEMVKKHESSFEGRLIVVSEKDKGLYDAMNKGISMASGEYLIFINADDELCPGILTKIKRVIDNCEKNPDIIYGDSINVYYDDNEQTTKIRHSYPEITCKTLKSGMGVVHQSMFTRRTVFEGIGGFDLEYSIGADWDFLIRSVKNGATMKYIETPICKFPTDGVSSKNHAMQRHKIRKKNELYVGIDFEMLRDVLNPAYILQCIVGSHRYNQIRFYHNKRKSTTNVKVI